MTRRVGAVEAGVDALAKEPAKTWAAVEYPALTTYEGDLRCHAVPMFEEAVANGARSKGL